MFIAGMSEGYTLDSGSPNRWDPAAVTAFNDALEDFKDGVNGTTGTETRNLAMVHTVEGEYRSSSHISTYAVSPRVATMRRRMPGYGS